MSSPSRPDYNLLALGPPVTTLALQRSVHQYSRFALTPSRSNLAGKEIKTSDWTPTSFLPYLATWDSFFLSCFSSWWDLWRKIYSRPQYRSNLHVHVHNRSIIPLMLELCCCCPQTQSRCLSSWCQVARRMIVQFLWRRNLERRGGRDGESRHCRNTNGSFGSSKRRTLSKPVLRVDGKDAMLGEVTIDVIL